MGLEKMRWPSGDTGVWVRFEDATCLEVPAFKGDGTEFYYKVGPLGPQQLVWFKYYGSFNWHRTIQTAFDVVAAKGGALQNVEVHVRKMDEGGQSYWFISDADGELADSRKDFELSEAARARTKDRTKKDGEGGEGESPENGERPAPPGPGGSAGAGPGAAPPPPSDADQGPPVTDPSDPGPGAGAPVANQPKGSYLEVGARALRCVRLAEAILLNPKAQLQSGEYEGVAVVHLASAMLGAMAGSPGKPAAAAVEEVKALVKDYAAPDPDAPIGAHPGEPGHDSSKQ